MIRVQGLSRSIGDRRILGNIDLEIREGEIMALVGPSGSGKTTFLRIINMLDRPSGGRVIINGVDACTSNDMELRRSMVLVFQKPVVFSMSVYENIAYGLRLRGVPRGEIDGRVKDVLKVIDMAGRESEYAGHLSGGEAQRVAFARAYVLKPKLLLLDEPTTNLDRQNVAIIERAIKDINERFGTTVVMVTHSLYQARRLADRAAVLIDGELVETGSVREVFEAPKDERAKAFVSGDMIF